MEKILKKVTVEREKEVAQIMSHIRPRMKRIELISYLKQAYSIFGIELIWVYGRKYVTLSLGYKDCIKTGPNSLFTGVTRNVPIADCVNVIEQVYAFRQQFLFVHRQALEIMER